MPLPVLVSGWEQAMHVAEVDAALDSLARRLADAYWPGSLTMVLPAKSGIPERLTAGRDTIAVRMPDHPVPLALAEALGRPITGTSANRSGEPDITEVAELQRILASRVDGIIAAGPQPRGIASTIVAVSAEGTTLLREGAVPYQAILGTIGIADVRR
jgi:L-threonylcarbamoyladenylate synthase